MDQFFFRTIVTWQLIILLFFQAGWKGQAMKYMYGGVLKQDLSSIKSTDEDISRIVMIGENYAIKRFPWSVPPRKRGKPPQIANISKVNLVYTHDNSIPLYAEDEVRDQHGQRHQITSLIIFGSVYRFILGWKSNRLRYVHNFTISVYPHNFINIYSHSFYIENLNTTVEHQNRYLFSKEQKLNILSKVSSEFSYVDGIVSINDVLLDKTKQRDSEIFETDMDQSDLKRGHVTSNFDQSDTTSCDREDGNCGGDSNLDPDAGRMRYLHHGRKTFKVMSYNVWNMNSNSSKYGGYTNRMDHLKETILSADPDIIGLQEMRYEEQKGESLGPSQIHTLSEGLPQYQFVYQPAQMQPNSLYDGLTEEGVAILSKYPILSHNYHLLFLNTSNTADLHQRILLQAEVLIPLLGTVHIFTTHLSLSHEAREQSVIQIWQHMKKQQGAAIFLGDLNAEPEERAMQYLCGKDMLTNADVPKLIDVWLEKHGNDNPGFTFNALDTRLGKRIDYMFLKVGGNCCGVDSSEIVDDLTRGLHAASDHLPLTATFSFDGSSQYL